jgi:hypothetical protein
MKLLAIPLGCHKDDSQVAGYIKLPAFGTMHHTYSQHDTAADIARAGVEAGIALD